jgi:hypothetical protein
MCEIPGQMKGSMKRRDAIPMMLGGGQLAAHNFSFNFRFDRL